MSKKKKYKYFFTFFSKIPQKLIYQINYYYYLFIVIWIFIRVYLLIFRYFQAYSVNQLSENTLIYTNLNEQAWCKGFFGAAPFLKKKKSK